MFFKKENSRMSLSDPLTINIEIKDIRIHPLINVIQTKFLKDNLPAIYLSCI